MLLACFLLVLIEPCVFAARGRAGRHSISVHSLPVLEDFDGMASSTSTRAQTMKHSKRRGGSRVLGHTKRKTPGKAGKLSSPPILAVMSETGERGPLLVWFVRVHTPGN